MTVPLLEDVASKEASALNAISLCAGHDPCFTAACAPPQAGQVLRQ